MCPRKSDGGPDWKPDAQSNYLVELAIRRGLPYPQALAAAARTKGESRA